MNKNTVIGFLLIAVVLIGFSIYNSHNYKKQVKAAFVKDSLIREAAKTDPRLADSLRIADSIRDVRLGVVRPQEVAPVADSAALIAEEKEEVYAPTYKDSLLELSSKGEEEIFTLENNKLKLDFTTKGAQIKQALVKDFYTYDSSALYLIKENYSKFALVFFTDQRLETSNFNFVKSSQTDTSIAFQLPLSGGAYIEYNYSLSPDSYLVDFNVVTKGLDKVIPKNANQIELDWNLKISRFEKGYDNEKNYSTLSYKYPGDASVDNLGFRKKESSKNITTKLSWFSFQQQFFSAILVSDNNFSGADLSYHFFEEDNPDNDLFVCNANASLEYLPQDETVLPFHYYFGPNLYKELKSYGYSFEKEIPLGKHIIGWINRVVIINVFDFLRRFISNYGIIILIMTILIKLVLSPLTLRSYMSNAKMKVLKPEVEKINAKYPRKEDALKKQQETMALYKKTGVNMMGGCIPMLLQIPILFAMFRFFPVSFELRQHSFLWASDLSGYDSILNLPFNIPLYGDHVSLFALLMAVSMYFYSKINLDQMPSTGQMAGMKSMQLYFMPLFMLVLCNNFSAGLSYYYMLSNFITIGQTWVIRKYFIDEEKLLAQLKSKASENAKKPQKKSKWRERMENMIKEQERLQKERGKRR